VLQSAKLARAFFMLVSLEGQRMTSIDVCTIQDVAVHKNSEMYEYFCGDYTDSSGNK
jgi:hypothetical protein